MPPRPAKPSAKVVSRLLETIKFLSCVTKDEGAPNETHVLLSNQTATAFNGTVGAGAKIEEDIYCAPHAKTFLNALQKCGEQYSLTQLDQGQLSIKSGKFKAVIPCIDPTLLYFPMPDANVAALNDNFKKALTLIEKVKPENGQRVMTLSFLMNGASVISTDGKIIIEAWHGINLPTDLPVPKACIPAILNNSKKLAGFGFSNSTVTFYFDDDSFVRSQLYAEKWNDVSHILNKPYEPKPVPEDFFKGLEAILPFSDGKVYFKDGSISSKREEDSGATFEVAGLQGGPIYNPAYLMLIKDLATSLNFHVEGPHASSYMLMFKGDTVRGGLMGFGQ